MKKTIAMAALALAVAGCQDAGGPAEAPALAPLLVKTAGQEVPGQYIVVLRDDVADPEQVARELVRAHGGRLDRAWKHALKGFAAELGGGAVEAVRADARVKYVEPVRMHRAIAATQTPPLGAWGLDRIDQVNLPLNRAYTYTTTASNVTAYIVDTGIQPNHPEFGTRAQAAYNARPVLGESAEDCNGHGTHSAAIVGGSTYGVAKGVQLRGVRVTDCLGNSIETWIVDGIEWVARNHRKPAVANISLAVPASQAINDAAKALSDAGVHVTAAAGNNSGADACNYSPAGAVGVTVVAQADSTDARGSGGNVGACVDLFAPGINILSAWIGSTTRKLSGSSEAAPHVAGAAAIYKATYGDNTSGAVGTWLVQNAQPKVRLVPTGTTNRLLYKGTL